jgi:hypothetical protein
LKATNLNDVELSQFYLNSIVSGLDTGLVLVTPEQMRSAVLQVYSGVLGSERNKINAIKLHRTLTGIGLKESKEYVESIIP